MTMKISIGNDHAGTDHKLAIVGMLQKKGIIVTNHGTDDVGSVDYPDFGHPVAIDVEQGRADFGIAICGSGNGIAMTVNKHQSVRGALCWLVEIAVLAREHNNANVICIPARYITVELAVEMVEAFIDTAFAGGRHQMRVGKIACK